MIGKGGLVTVSAGNGGAESTYADNKSLISVSATDSTDTLTSWSSYGNYIDVAAPGTNIYTTEYGGGYAAVAGTSFSSPIAASIIALIFAANPALTPAEAETILKSTATDLGTSGWDKSFGYGRVDADAAVTKALAFVNNPSPDTLAPTVSHALAADSTVTGTQAIDITASDDVGVSKVEVWIDDKLLGTDSSAPFSLSWNTTAVTNGSHIIKAIAFDSAGNQGTAQVTVNVKNVIVVDTVSPSVTITSPRNGATIRSNTQFKIVASDDIAVKQIACYFDNTLVGSSTGLSAMSCNVNTRKYAVGPHTFKTIATDAAKNSGTTSITVNVIR